MNWKQCNGECHEGYSFCKVVDGTSASGISPVALITTPTTKTTMTTFMTIINDLFRNKNIRNQMFILQM